MIKSSRLKKTLGILLVVCFLMSMTAIAVSAKDPQKCYREGYRDGYNDGCDHATKYNTFSAEMKTIKPDKCTKAYEKGYDVGFKKGMETCGSEDDGED